MSDGKVVQLFSSRTNSELADRARAERKLLRDVQCLATFLSYIEMESNKLGLSELSLLVGAAQLSIAELAKDLRHRLSSEGPD